jgi:hypothetical protein
VDTGDELRQRLRQRLAQQEALLRQLRERLDSNTTNAVGASVAGMAVVGLELVHDALTVAIGELDAIVHELADRAEAKAATVNDALGEAATGGRVHAVLHALATQTPRLVTGAMMAPVDALATSCLRVLREVESATRWSADTDDTEDGHVV